MTLNGVLYIYLTCFVDFSSEDERSIQSRLPIPRLFESFDDLVTPATNFFLIDLLGPGTLS
jgi:hypothetical protein